MHYKSVHLKSGLNCSQCYGRYATIQHLNDHWLIAHEDIPWNEELFQKKDKIKEKPDESDVMDVDMAAQVSDTVVEKQLNRMPKVKLVVSLVDLKDNPQTLAPNIREQLIEISKEIVNTVTEPEPLPENKEEKVYILLSSDDCSQEEPLDLSIQQKSEMDDDSLFDSSKFQFI